MEDGQTLRFAHVLFQNAILDSITEAEAAGLHARAAEILLAADAEAQGEQAQQDLAPDLAYHFDRAGDWPRAAHHHLRAAQAAWRIYALDVCIGHLDHTESAIALAGADATDDALFCDFVTLFCRVLDVAGRWNRLAQVAAAHLPRLRTSPDTRSQIVVLMLQSKAFNQLSHFEDARTGIETALDMAEQAGDEDALAMTRTVQMDILNDRPDGPDSAALQRLFEETQDYVTRRADAHIAVLRLYEMAAFWRQMGDVPRARALAQDILSYAQEHDDSHARAFGGWVMASVTAMVEEYDQTRSYAAEAMRHALPGTMDHVTAQTFHAGATLMLGQPSMTPEELTALSDFRSEAGDTTMAIVSLFYAAGSLFAKGRVRAGIATLARTDALVDVGCEWGLRQQYLIKKAEFHLTIAGLLPSPLPQPRLALAEAPAALRLRMGAKANARTIYDMLERDFAGGQGVHAARISLGRGLLEGRKGRDRIERALETFRAQELPALAKMAGTVLSQR